MIPLSANTSQQKEGCYHMLLLGLQIPTRPRNPGRRPRATVWGPVHYHVQDKPPVEGIVQQDELDALEALCFLSTGGSYPQAAEQQLEPMQEQAKGIRSADQRRQPQRRQSKQHLQKPKHRLQQQQHGRQSPGSETSSGATQCGFSVAELHLCSSEEVHPAALPVEDIHPAALPDPWLFQQRQPVVQNQHQGQQQQQPVVSDLEPSNEPLVAQEQQPQPCLPQPKQEVFYGVQSGAGGGGMQQASAEDANQRAGQQQLQHHQQQRQQGQQPVLQRPVPPSNGACLAAGLLDDSAVLAALATLGAGQQAAGLNPAAVAAQQLAAALAHQGPACPGDILQQVKALAAAAQAGPLQQAKPQQQQKQQPSSVAPIPRPPVKGCFWHVYIANQIQAAQRKEAEQQQQEQQPLVRGGTQQSGSAGQKTTTNQQQGVQQQASRQRKGSLSEALHAPAAPVLEPAPENVPNKRQRTTSLQQVPPGQPADAARLVFEQQRLQTQSMSPSAQQVVAAGKSSFANCLATAGLSNPLQLLQPASTGLQLPLPASQRGALTPSVALLAPAAYGNLQLTQALQALAMGTTATAPNVGVAAPAAGAPAAAACMHPALAAAAAATGGTAAVGPSSAAPPVGLQLGVPAQALPGLFNPSTLQQLLAPKSSSLSQPRTGADVPHDALLQLLNSSSLACMAGLPGLPSMAALGGLLGVPGVQHS